MSPAHQGNLEVERYIGSYLISQRTPPNIKASNGSKRYQNHNVKPKPADTETVRNYNKYSFCQRDHHVGGPPRYSLPPPPLPIECQGYGGPPGSGWAGVPLISMTSGNHRRNKKNPSVSNQHQIQRYYHKQPQNISNSNDVEERSPNEPDRSPFTRLAIHTQGAPLIQAGRFSNNNRNRNNVTPHRSEAVRWDTAKDLKTPADTQHKEQTDSLSVASDESSGNSENSLPRIIKPRKRRKKDRKPLTGTNLTSTQNETPQFSIEPDGHVVSSTLNTVLPLCSEHHAADRSDNNKRDLLPDNIVLVDEKQIEDLIDPLASADEFPLGNLLDDEEDNDSELSSCAPVAATLCQCRYCDPSGVIWDVDQRCYSPFLTPPPPAYRPHGDIGSLLRRSWSEPSSSKVTSDPVVQDSRPSSPVGLQVSSEIVTSPNGHRDIEIKFYSSSSSASDSTKPKSIGSDRYLNERCFVVEE